MGEQRDERRIREKLALILKFSNDSAFKSLFKELVEELIGDCDSGFMCDALDKILNQMEIPGMIKKPSEKSLADGA